MTPRPSPLRPFAAPLVPCLQEGGGEGDGGSVTMSFVMPSKYTLDNLPRPENDNVKIKEVGVGGCGWGVGW